MRTGSVFLTHLRTCSLGKARGGILFVEWLYLIIRHRYVLVHHVIFMAIKKTASRVGAGLAAGAALGLALGLFLQSRKGKELTKDAQKNAKLLQKQVMKKLENVEEISKEKYGEVVDQVMSFYEKSKDVTKKELPEVRAYLMGRWKEIQGHLEK